MTERSFQLPAKFKVRKRGSCVPAVITLLPGLNDHDAVIEGWVLSGNLRHEHTWLEVAGMMFDPTAEQFRGMACWKETPMRYEIKSVWPVWSYRMIVMEKMSLWWRERIASFGGMNRG